MGHNKSIKRFCPGCGEDVDTYVMERLVSSFGEIKEELCCINCSMPVEDRCKKEFVSAEAILVSDDSSMIRELLCDFLTKNKLSKKVVPSKNGSDFITLFSRSISKKALYSLVVLDVGMPVLNGINAAIAMRAIEKALKMDPTPILFFTAHKCDEKFKRVLSHCKPAHYVNKGGGAKPDLLASRIGQVVKRLLKDSQGLCA